MSSEWTMVIITAVYVVATIFICIANFKSANATKKQLEVLKKQYDEQHQPYITTELIYVQRLFFGLRFTNHGNRIAETVKIDFDQQFVNCLKGSFKQSIEEQKGKECVIGIGQHYDLFIGSNDIRGQEDLVPAKGIIKYRSCGQEYESVFHIDLKNYMTFFSVTSNEEKIQTELKNQNDKLERIGRSLVRIADQYERTNNE